MATSAERLYPLDSLAESDPQAFWENTEACYSSLILRGASSPIQRGASSPIQRGASSQEFFLTSDGEQVRIEKSSISRLPLYRDDPKHSLLVLMKPPDREAGLAVYINDSWWAIEDILKTSDSRREGLLLVQSFGERIVLFVLNCLVYGSPEESSEDDPEAAVFVPHSSKEQAKLFWQRQQAIAFYTVKPKGSLCDGSTSQCYQLPVLDTAFVRQSWRRRGLMTTMLQDFFQGCAADQAIGISCPLSAAMYQVCHRFLQSHPEERDRLWEVEAPGDWSQRESVWLKIKLKEHKAPKASSKETSDFSIEKVLEQRTSQSGVTKGIWGLEDASNWSMASEHAVDTRGRDARTISSQHQEDAVHELPEPRSCKKANKRKLEEADPENSPFKHVKSGS